MRILFDQGTPAPLRDSLVGHEVRTAFEMQWSDLANGELLAAAEGVFDVLITTDRNLRFQQRLADGWPSWFCQPQAGREFASALLKFSHQWTACTLVTIANSLSRTDTPP